MNDKTTAKLSKAQINFLQQCFERERDELRPLSIIGCKFARTLIRQQYLELRPFVEQQKELLGVFLAEKARLLINAGADVSKSI